MSTTNEAFQDAMRARGWVQDKEGNWNKPQRKQWGDSAGGVAAGPKFERAVQADTLGSPQLEEEDSSVRPGRYRVEVISHRKRLIDTDNLCPKFHIDALRYAGLIPDDSPEHIELVVRQVRSKENKTEIVIEPITSTPEPPRV